MIKTLLWYIKLLDRLWNNLAYNWMEYWRVIHFLCFWVITKKYKLLIIACQFSIIYTTIASFDISVFGLLAEWDRRLLGYERLAVQLMTERITARNFLQRCTVAARKPPRRFGHLNLPNSKQKCEFAKGQVIDCSEEFYS